MYENILLSDVNFQVDFVPWVQVCDGHLLVQLTLVCFSFSTSVGLDIGLDLRGTLLHAPKP